MSDADWDADDFEPSNEAPAVKKVDDKWAGEDEEEDLKDNWDEESEDEKEKVTTAQEPSLKKKPKDKFKKIAEKEALRKAEIEAKRKAEEESRQQLTPEEQAAEKLRQQKIQEDADLELARDAFGVGNEEAAGVLDAFKPESNADFEQFKELLHKKISQFERSPHYFGFIESLFRDLSINLESEEIKKLGSQLSAMSSEKAKQQKAAKGKKKKGPSAKLNAGRDNNYEDYTVGGYDDYDDFI